MYEGQSIASEPLPAQKVLIGNYRPLLVNLTFALSLFCFIKLLPFSGEVQPIAAISAVLLLLLPNSKISRSYIFFVFALIAYLLLSLSGLSGNKDISPAIAIETFLALLAPVTIFTALFRYFSLISFKVYFFILLFWFYIGFSQSYYPLLQTALKVDLILAELISRYSSVALIDYGRGATLLAPEPSYSAPFIILFGLIAYYFFTIKKINKISLVALVFMVLWLGVMNRSGTFGVIALVFLFFLLIFMIYERGLIALPFFLLSIFLFFFYFFYDDFEEVRFIEVVFGMFHVIYGAESFSEALVQLSPFSGQRNVSVLIGYSQLFTGSFAGGGLGSWSVSFVDQANRLGINLLQFEFFRDQLGAETDVKPSSFFALSAFDMGFVGILLGLMFLVKPFYEIKLAIKGGGRDIVGMAGLWTGAFFLLIAGPVSLPAYWLILIVSKEIIMNRYRIDRDLPPRISYRLV